MIEELQLYFLPVASTSQPDLEQFWEHADYFLNTHELEADFNWWWENEYGTNKLKLTGNPEEVKESMKKLGMSEEEIETKMNA